MVLFQNEPARGGWSGALGSFRRLATGLFGTGQASGGQEGLVSGGGGGGPDGAAPGPAAAAAAADGGGGGGVVLSQAAAAGGDAGCNAGSGAAAVEAAPARSVAQGRVLYGTQGGTAARLAREVAAIAAQRGMSMKVTDLEGYEVEGLWKEGAVLLVLPTYEGGTPPPSAAWFCRWLEESAEDFRVGAGALGATSFAVFGCGNSQYDENFNKVAKTVDSQLRRLGASPLCGQVALGDEDTGEMDTQLQAWAEEALGALQQKQRGGSAAAPAASTPAADPGAAPVAHAPAAAFDAAASSTAAAAAAPAAAATLEATAVAGERADEGGVGAGAALGGRGSGAPGEGVAEQNEEEEEEGGDSEGEESEEEEGEEVGGIGSGDDVDMEDLAGPSHSRAKGSAARGAARGGGGAGEQHEVAPPAPKRMLSATQRASLIKQGYKIIGPSEHSGVKLCRWTKSMLRGRGGCYKHAMYGIESHRCMEATPSLACANKCQFCWRHHTNPVGREWKWLMDGPEEIVEAALNKHVAMVNEYKGVPGVLPNRLEEGFKVAHCALSLVGEPIMYPKIAHLVEQLHARRVSTFLVTNAQFPDAVRALGPVTQLYVSVDAATKETLKAVDRPLFKDFWERFRECLTLLRDKHQRTVYRLTLVKGWNMEEIANYAALLALGRPDFVEVKGVTYCGTSGASSLTMANVPYHADVRAFCEALIAASKGVVGGAAGEGGCSSSTREGAAAAAAAAAVGDTAAGEGAAGGVSGGRGGGGRDDGGVYEYGLAAEHEHSCCVLLARRDRFFVGGRWHTWIDYERFQELVRSGEPFGSEDYMAPTPAWAEYGSQEAGFDPVETRVRKERRHPGKQQQGQQQVVAAA